MPNMPKSFGHVREVAEIESSSGISTPITYQPTGYISTDQPSPLQSVEINTVALANAHGPRAFRLSVSSSTSHMPSLALSCGENVAPPLFEDRNAPTEFDEHSLSPAPLIPPKNPLRGAPSLPSLRTPVHNAVTEVVGTTSDGPRTTPKMGPLGTMSRMTQSATTRQLSRRPFAGGSISHQSSQGGIRSLSRRPSLPRPNNIYSTGSPLSKAELNATNPRTPNSQGRGYSSRLITPEDSSSSVFGSVQSMGSGRMVDLFLSSRRRKIAGSEDTEAFV
jgi:hypothetical protein